MKILIFAALLLYSCTSEPHPSLMTIKGHFKASDSQPLPDIKVTIEEYYGGLLWGDRKVITTAWSDKDGNFRIPFNNTVPLSKKPNYDVLIYTEPFILDSSIYGPLFDRFSADDKKPGTILNYGNIPVMITSPVDIHFIQEKPGRAGYFKHIFVKYDKGVASDFYIHIKKTKSDTVVHTRAITLQQNIILSDSNFIFASFYCPDRNKVSVEVRY